MVHEQDYRTLAHSLVQVHGDGALEYAQRFAGASPSGQSEAGKVWFRVAKTIEQLIVQKDRRRQNDLAPLYN